MTGENKFKCPEMTVWGICFFNDIHSAFKIDATSNEQMLDDVKPFLDPSEDVGLLTKNNLMHLLEYMYSTVLVRLYLSGIVI